MTALDLVSDADFRYAKEIRRKIHQYPELGFELQKTSALVKNELEQIGISCSTSYAPCSISGYIGNGKRTIGLRADMDALPIEEKTGLPFASLIPGCMHACGHDAHTAILLTVARILKRNEDMLSSRVKLLFQPSEECEISGAKAMLDKGAVDDVDYVICTHCDNGLTSQRIGICAGDYMAACDPITIVFKGKAAHATMPEKGVDAIAMACEAVGLMKDIARRIAVGKDYVFSVGYFHGGTAHNIISDKCVLKISFRYFDVSMASQIKQECIECCNNIAKKAGGTVEIDWYMSAPVVHNEERLVNLFCQSVQRVLPDKLELLQKRRSTEDFAWFLTKKPGFLFRFGTGNPESGNVSSAHSSDFVIDERGMQSAILAFTQFIIDDEVATSI